MKNICLILFGLMLVCNVFAKHNEWYCKVADDKYQICRKCIDLNEDCDKEPRTECKCENWKFANFDYELIGGTDECQSSDSFCYVTKSSSCSDSEYSSVNDRFNNIWLNTDVHYSKKACEANSQDDNIGNEEFLESTRIVGDRIKDVLDNGILGDDIYFWLDDQYECQDECNSRVGLCGAWSFDNIEGKCYLHTVNSCCGQFGKREANSDWISGYVCPHCWSTLSDTDCPCTIDERAVMPKTAHGAGGKSPLHATSSGSLVVKSIKGGEDKCKCIPKRTKRGRFRCIKPVCKKPTLNFDNNPPTSTCPEGCCDKRKCKQSKKGKKRTGTRNSIPRTTPRTTRTTTTKRTPKPCRTKDGKKCELPFIHQGKKYEACPQDPDDPNETWCSTRTNRNGEHVGGGGHYGFCGDNCPKI